MIRDDLNSEKTVSTFNSVGSNLVTKASTSLLKSKNSLFTNRSLLKNWMYIDIVIRFIFELII